MIDPAAARDDVYLTTNEAAKLLKMSPRTLERLRVEGTGPRFFKAGAGKRARVLYQKAELIAWLTRHSFRSTSEYSRLNKLK